MKLNPPYRFSGPGRQDATYSPLPHLTRETMDLQPTKSAHGIHDLLKQAASIGVIARLQAAGLDQDSCFPVETMRALAAAGLLAASLPISLGGAGLADAAGGLALLRLLHVLGHGNLAVGRIFEAHVNAIRLVMRYGTNAQKRTAAQDVGAGLLFALWVTDASDAPLQISPQGAAIVLTGAKSFCSAAGYADRAIVTATVDGEQPSMLLLALNCGERVLQSGAALHGMRAAITRRVDFSNCTVASGALLGAPGDYLREPEFSTGAWRSSAVALGGLAALLALAREQLIARGRDSDPHQRARLGRATIAHHTGWLWLERAAAIAQDDSADATQAVAYVNLARTAVEAAAMEALHCVQRSLGLAAFLQGNPVERVSRDLSTYLRQPAPDEALDEASSYFMTHAVPGEPR